VHCTECHHEQAAAARFCKHCGAESRPACAGCGASLSAAARFCTHCGLEAAAASAPGIGPLDAAAPAEREQGERRQITVAFCDLVGSTELSRRLGLEEFSELLAAYQEACSQATKLFDGHVAQFLGDGVLVYFGYPQAHEDDAERAVRAALAIQTSLRELSKTRADGAASIDARIGVHSGLAVVGGVGDDGRSSPLALGETTTLAARIQQSAPAGAVVVSDATLRLVSGLFVTRRLDAVELEGTDTTSGVHCVERASGVRGLLLDPERVAPIVGREQELDQFRDRWDQVLEGRGQVFSIVGEAGIGKSRLLHACRKRLEGSPHTSFEIGCSPYFAGSAFQPLIDLYERGFDFREEESPEQQLAKLVTGLSRIPGLELAEVIPYLGALLDLPASEAHPLPHMSPEVQRDKTIGALLLPPLAIEAQQPVVVWCEDLHWCDPSTLELLGRLVDQTPTRRLMLVLTHRPDFEAPWSLGRSYLSQLSLTRLSQRDTREVIAMAANWRRLPEPLIEQIAARADGVPLFAEELARSVVDSGLVVERDGRFEFHGRLADIEIPTTLQGSLMSRLDRLSAAKRVAQLAAVLGREFSYSLIEAVADIDVPTLRSGLAQLVANEILYQRGTPPDSLFTFKHALLQDTAYESLLKSRRRELHARAASSLVERFPERAATEPQVLARHCELGGLASEAISHYERAGRQALARLAEQEAVDCFGNALEQLDTLPESEERDLRELALRLGLSGPLASLRGYGAPESTDSCTRIEELCERIAPGATRLPALVGLAVYHQLRGDIPRAARFAAQLLEVAEPLGIVPLQVAANTILGASAITSRTIPEACARLERALKLARDAKLPDPVNVYETDLRFIVSSIQSIAMVLAGRPEAGRRALNESLRRADAVDHLYTRVSALSGAATTCYFLDDAKGAARFAERSLHMLRGLGFHQPESQALVFGGWARTCCGERDGIDDIESGIELATSKGALGGIAQLHLTAAEALGRIGDLSRAHHFLDRAQRIIDETGERTAFEPQLPMFRANLILDSKSGTLEAAEELIRESIDRWEAYQSPWMELRSTILLGRVALESGGAGDARVRLERLLARIEAGEEAPRLRLARALLSRLRKPTQPGRLARG
jgi:class 3 adenylate cyclase